MPRTPREPLTPEDDTSTRILTLRLPGWLVQRVRHLATKDRRSVNQFLRLELERLVSRRAKQK
jgi:hypothetical protein